MEQRPIDYIAKSPPRIRVLFASIGLGVAGLLWLVAGNLTKGRANQIALFSALLSGVLTLVIAWIYLKIAEDTTRQTNLQKQMMDIQSQQATIMEQQQELMEFQHVPRVRVRNFELLPDNEIRLTLTNVGNGLAEQMFLRTAVFVRPSPDELPTYDLADETFTLDNENSALRPGYTQLMRKEEGIVASDLLGETLQPNESEVAFRSRAQLGLKPLNRRKDQYGFTSMQPILDELYETGFLDVHIELSIVYSDIKEGTYTEYVVGRTVSLESGDREIEELVNTDFVTHWSPMDDEERLEKVDKLGIYPPR